MSTTQKYKAFYSLDEAAQLASKHRDTIKRALQNRKFPNAVQKLDRNRTWQIPITDLIQAGFVPMKIAQQILDEPQQEPQEQTLNISSTVSSLPIPSEPTKSVYSESNPNEFTAINGQLLGSLLVGQIRVTEILLGQIKALAGAVK